MIATIPPTLTNKERLVIVRNEQVYDYCLQLCDILDEDSRAECLLRADWAGGYLYLRWLI